MFEQLLAGLTALRPFAWRTALALSVFCASLLFLPDRFVEEFSLSDLLNEARPTLAILLLLSLSILFVEVFEFSREQVDSKIKKWSYRRNRLRFLRDLSEDEKAALKPYLLENISTQHFSLSSGVAKALEGKGLITQSSNLGAPGMGDCFPFMIQPVVLDLLRKNPTILE